MSMCRVGCAPLISAEILENIFKYGNVCLTGVLLQIFWKNIFFMTKSQEKVVKVSNALTFGHREISIHTFSTKWVLHNARWVVGCR